MVVAMNGTPQDAARSNSDSAEESLRMVSSQPQGNEPISDEELRPQVLDGFIGQPRLKAQLQLFLDAARKGTLRLTTFSWRVLPVWARPPWR